MRLASVESEECGEIKEGTIVDASGKHQIFIRDFIPRFVTGDTYADSFGEQWNRYRSVQIDSENNLNLSAQRFYRWTGWKKDELRGLRILEAGCGAGRFTQVMLDADATVYSFDLSSAVDACWRTNGPNDNLCLLQADIFQIPCKTESFDRVFCYGVLQHTPDPKAAFLLLIPIPAAWRRNFRRLLHQITTSQSVDSQISLAMDYQPYVAPTAIQGGRMVYSKMVADRHLLGGSASDWYVARRDYTLLELHTHAAIDGIVGNATKL